MITDLSIRPIRPEDDAAVAAIIRAVMPEFGAVGPGFAIVDPEVDAMSAAYAAPGSAYYVLERAGRLLGGGGVGPLAGVDAGVCELRKMYFLEEARGAGAGKALLAVCLAAARGFGYRTMYLETLTGMDAARALYERTGFVRLAGPMGRTGHFGCNRFYALALEEAPAPDGPPLSPDERRAAASFEVHAVWSQDCFASRDERDPAAVDALFLSLSEAEASARARQAAAGPQSFERFEATGPHLLGQLCDERAQRPRELFRLTDGLARALLARG